LIFKHEIEGANISILSHRD